MRAFWTLSASVILLLCADLTGYAQRQSASNISTSTLIQRVIEITNHERVKMGLPPLKRHDTLGQAAGWMAQDMATHRFFDHQDSQGRTLGLRLQDFGYAKLRSVGENIAAGQEGARDVVDSWLKSPGHRANLLGATYREIGVGYVASPRGEYDSYWVQDFGMRSRIYPVVINEEHAETDSPKVHLYIYGEGWAVKMRISNDNEHWSAWESYTAEKDWEIENAPGKHTVYVQLQNEDMDTQTSEDSIELAAPGADGGSKTVKPNPVKTDTLAPAKPQEPVKQDPPPVTPPKKDTPKKDDPPPVNPPKKDPPPDPPKKDPPPADPPKKDPPKKDPVPDC